MGTGLGALGTMGPPTQDRLGCVNGFKGLGVDVHEILTRWP